MITILGVTIRVVPLLRTILQVIQTTITIGLLRLPQLTVLQDGIKLMNNLEEKENKEKENKEKEKPLLQLAALVSLLLPMRLLQMITLQRET